MALSKEECLQLNRINLDAGCGSRKQLGFIGMDRRDVPGVDIVHNLEELPWPLADESCNLVLLSHVLEHLDPRITIDLFNEIWRVLRPAGSVLIAGPYANSDSGYQDPTHCYYPDTEVLTKSGFKLISDVSLGEELLVLDPATLQTMYSPCVETTNEPYEGELLHFLTRRMDLLVTPNHQMVWAPGGASEVRSLNVDSAGSFTLLRGHHSRRGYGMVSWEGQAQKVFTLPERPPTPGKGMPFEFQIDDFCAFLGWYLSEGNVEVDHERGEYRCVIHQSTDAYPEHVEEIQALLGRMGFSPYVQKDRVRFYSKELVEYLAPLGKSWDKYIPGEIKQLPPAQLRVLIDSLVKGDGTSNGGGWEYATVSPQLASDVQEIALKAGYRSTVYAERRPGTRILLGREVNQRDIYLVGISPPADLFYPRPQSMKYQGRVVCVTARDHHIILVRRNGRVAWCGNTRPGHTVKCFWYFDPVHSPDLYGIYQPKPFKYREDVSTYRVGLDFNVVLEKRLRADEENPQTVRVA